MPTPKFKMPTPNTELNSDIEVSSAPLNVESTDGISDLILLNAEDTNIDSFTELPIDFDTSNSSMETVESIEDGINVESSIPMLTDIAEETIYETDFFEENLKCDSEHSNLNSRLDGCTDISDIPIDINSILKPEESIEEISESQLNELNKSTENSDESDSKSNSEVPNNDDNCDDSNTADEHIFVTLSSDNGTGTNTVSLADMRSEMKIVPNLIENITIESTPTGDSGSVNVVEVVPSSSKNNIITSNLINVNSITAPKMSTFKPIAVQNTSKFVPISIAPNSMKRPASISIGQPSTNLLTKVVVSQSKVGQPIMITSSPQKNRPLCLFQSNQSPVKSITFAQAKQMGLLSTGKLQPIRPSTAKSMKPKVVVGNLPTVAQGLKKIQPITKPSTPTKILPAPLVSNSTTASQPQKIFIRQDYLMKSGTLIPKQQAGQVITISNLQTPVISNHVSPKKQVQFIKLLNNIGSTNMPTVTTTKGKITTLAPTMPKIDKDTPIIVASSNFTAANLNVKNATTVQTSNTTTGITVLPMITTGVKPTPGQRLLLPAVSKNKTDVPSQSLLTDPKQLKPAGNIVVLPDDVLEKIKGELLQAPIKLKEDTIPEIAKLQDNLESVQEIRTVTRSPTKHILPPSAAIESGNGLRSRKPCNCTRSQCLKLYCECFANGEFCNNCNCVSCHNNISHEENRQHAIRSCLDRNPQAFRPKIGKCLVGLSDRRHTKGCHCKRSGCLKNYCECYEAQIPCSENCKCVGCKNVDDMLFATSFTNSFEKTETQVEFQNFSKNKLTAEINDAVGQSGTSASPRHAFSFVKDQVVEATCQCLLAQAEEVKRRNINIEDGKKYILEEFGRCLIQIIECAKKSYDNLSEKCVSS